MALLARATHIQHIPGQTDAKFLLETAIEKDVPHAAVSVIT